MKRILFFGFLLIFVAPFAASAQGVTGKPYARYCPDPSKIFNGSIYYENNKPWIEVKVDPDFERDELRGKRHITGDIPLTPVYDLVVQIKPEFNYYCIPGWVEGAPVTAEQLPPFLHVTAAIVVGTKDEQVVDPVVFSRTDKKDEQGRFIYERKMKGWPHGVAFENTRLERLVDEVNKGRWLQESGVNVSTVNVLITIPKIEGETERLKEPVSFNLCTPIWGNGVHAVVGMRATKSLRAADMVNYYDFRRQAGFAAIEPYASNQRYFSYAVDLTLREQADSYPTSLLQTLKERKQWVTSTVQNEILRRYFEGSACPNGLYLQTVSSGELDPLGADGIAILGASPVRGALIENGGSPRIFVHELSHFFAGINDEYIYRRQYLQWLRVPLKTCSIDPANDFSFRGKLYGGTRYEGCSFLFTGEKATAPDAKFYRSTNESIMRTVGNRKFGVVPCGYILAAIKGGDAKSYFPECAKMDGVIKDGVTAQGVFERVFAALGTFLQPSLNPPPTTLQAVPPWKGGMGREGNLAAASGAAIPTGAKVKVIVPESRTPPAEFEAIAKGVKLAPPEQCLDATGQRVFADDPNPFRAQWAKDAKCAQKIADVTVSDEKLADSSRALDSAERFLNSVRMTKKSIIENAGSGAFSLVAVPIGGLAPKQYQTAESVAVSCFTSASGGVAGPVAPVGASKSEKGFAFVDVTKEQSEKLSAVKKEISVAHKIVSGTLAQGKEVGLINTFRFANVFRRFFKELKDDFALITPEAYAKNHAALPEGSSIAFSVTLTPDAACKFPSLPGIMKRFDLVKEGEHFVTATLSLDGLSVSGFCLPTVSVGEGVREGITELEKRFEALTRTLSPVVPILRDLRDGIEWADYGCADNNAEPGASGENRIVRKSGTTPADRRAAAQQPPLNPLLGKGGEEEGPSYLIVESFDPKNPWGEIVEVVGDEEITGEITRSDLVENKADTITLSVDGATDALNLLVTTPTISGSAAGVNRLFAGEMTLRAEIKNEGGEIRQTFNNTLQYRAATEGSPWIDWVKFEVAGLRAGGRAEVTHIWDGGAGEWEFRLVADSGNAVAESNEPDNYSGAAGVSIIAREGATAPSPPPSGTPKLVLATPVISGRQAGFGKVYAGSMTISERVTNIGDGVVPPFQILLLYSQNGRDWSDWVRVDSLRLAPEAERAVFYTWNGRVGGWYFKACEDITDSCSARAFVEVMPI